MTIHEYLQGELGALCIDLAKAKAERDTAMDGQATLRAQLFRLACADHGSDPPKALYCPTCGKTMAQVAQRIEVP